QLHKIAFSIKNSTTIILPQWYVTLAELNLKAHMMPRDISMCWNLTFDMVDFTIDYQPAIDAITANHDMKDAEEWTIAKELCDTLKHGTLFFSCNTPNISTVIPVMDHIDQHLATFAENPCYSTAIHTALAIGKRTLNHYYNKTDHSKVYRIAMGKLDYIFKYFLSFLKLLLVLHPCHKLQYFKTAGWEEEWVDAAEQIVHNEFDQMY
ncbi:hypothetical protein K443DRAFT_68183, partial [Laccaria amethystina LaAM-08-1]